MPAGTKRPSRYAFALLVAEAQSILCDGGILLGSFAKPLHGLHLILRHAFAFDKHFRRFGTLDVLP